MACRVFTGYGSLTSLPGMRNEDNVCLKKRDLKYKKPKKKTKSGDRNTKKIKKLKTKKKRVVSDMWDF